MYEVIKYFTDLHDNGYPYQEGDIFPRQGLGVSKARITDLSTNRNLQKTPLIKEVPDINVDPEGENIPEQGTTENLDSPEVQESNVEQGEPKTEQKNDDLPEKKANNQKKTTRKKTVKTSKKSAQE